MILRANQPDDCIFAVTATVPAIASCDFDYGLCSGWRQSNSDIFNWTRHYGSTLSSSTGPDQDHTSGSGEICILILWLNWSTMKRIILIEVFLVVRILQYGLLRWTANELISANCFINSWHKITFLEWTMKHKSLLLRVSRTMTVKCSKKRREKHKEVLICREFNENGS